MRFIPRKPTRLSEFDYSHAGYYFVTLCTKDMRQILWNPSVGAAICRPEQKLSCYGRIIDEAIQDIPKHYDNIFVNKYVVMPNHIHMIIIIEPPDSKGRQIAAPTTSLSTVVGQLKRVVSLRIGYSIWQKSFHDHIIRNEADYKRIWQYIHENPMRWEQDRYFQS